jgi:hypothetical protein
MKNSKLSVGLMVLAVVMVTGTTFGAPPPLTTPDGGSSSLLLSMAFAGLAAARKFLR